MRIAVLTCCLVVLPVAVVAGLYNRELGVVKKAGLDNRLISGFVLDQFYGVSTLLRCQVVCLQNVWCDSLFFNKESGLCQTNNKIFTGSEIYTKNIGTKYYTRKKADTESVPDSFVSHSLRIKVSVILSSVSWGTGDAFCQSIGGLELVSLDTMEKFNFVLDIIKSYKSLDIDHQVFIVGATDYGTGGIWRWNNGASLSVTSSMWCNGEPNNADYILFSQDYAAMRNDAKCGLKLVDIFSFEGGFPVCALPYP